MHNKHLNPSVLFVVSGLGLGNSTRCLAVIEQLTDRGIPCDVATFGKGIEFFAENEKVRNLVLLKSIHCFSFNWFHLLISLFEFILVTIFNDGKIFLFARKHNIKLIVYDSVYGVLPRIFLKKCSVISLNNSDRIVEEVCRWTHLPFSTWLQFILVECFDYCFQKLVPQWVLSPWPFRYEKGSKKNRSHFVDIEPIVRSSVMGSLPFSKPPLLFGNNSGSRINRDLKPLLKQMALVLGAKVISDSSDEDMSMNMNKENIPLLNKAHMFLSNAGFSSISEGLKRQVPMVVVPLHGHSEQWVNAKLIERMGLGVLVEEKKMHKVESHWLLEKIKQAEQKSHFYSISCNGAVQATQWICKIIKQELDCQSPP